MIKKLELILCIAFVAALAFRLFNVQEFDWMIVYSLVPLSILYFGFGWLIFKDEQCQQNYYTLSIITGIVYSIGIIGILFYSFNFMGASPLLLIAWTVTLFFLLPFMIWKKIQGRLSKRYFRSQIIRSAIISTMCACAYFSYFI